MELRREAVAILQVFVDRGCERDDVVYFGEFGEAIVWEAGFIKDEGTREALQELLEGKYVVEYNAGLSITAKGLKEVKNS